jgi:hypothetical protein
MSAVGQNEVCGDVERQVLFTYIYTYTSRKREPDFSNKNVNLSEDSISENEPKNKLDKNKQGMSLKKRDLPNNKNEGTF